MNFVNRHENDALTMEIEGYLITNANLLIVKGTYGMSRFLINCRFVIKFDKIKHFKYKQDRQLLY